MSQLLREVSATQLNSILPFRQPVDTGNVQTYGLQVRENPQAGYVLTSDDVGNATWESAGLDPTDVQFVRGLGLTSDSLNYTLLQTAPAQTVDYTLTFPETPPTAVGQSLTLASIGSGQLQWDAITTGNTQQIVQVNKAPQNGQFGSIEAALTSITDASASKPYVVFVAAGVYVEQGLVVPPYVTVTGSDPCSTQIEAPAVSTSDILLLQDHTCLNNISIRGATTTGFAAIAIRGGGESVLHNVAVASSDIGLLLDITGGESHRTLIRSLSGSQHVTSFVVVHTDASSSAYVQCQGIEVVATPTGVTPLLVDLDGEGVDVTFSNALLSRESGATLYGTAVRVSNSASLIVTNGSVFGYITGFELPSDGGTPSLRVEAVEHNNTMFIDAPNPSADGHVFTDITNRNVININTTNSLVLSNRDNFEVTVSKKGGDFETVEAAVAFITSKVPSVTNLWVISIGAGIYNENNPLTIPAYVTLRGTGTTSTVINALDNTSPIFEIAAVPVTIKNISLRNADGVGGAGITFDGSIPTSSSFTLDLRTVNIQNCATAVDLTNTNGVVFVLLINCSISGIGSACDFGVRLQQVSTIFQCVLFISEFNLQLPATYVPTLANPYIGVSIQGLNGALPVTCAFDTMIFAQAGNVTGDGSTAIAVSNCTLASNSFSLNRFAVCIDVVASTLPVVLSVTNFTVINSTLTLLNANNNSSGSVFGIFDDTTIDQTAAPNNTVTFVIQNTSGSGGLSVTGALQLGENADTLVDFIPGLTYNVTPGLQLGGTLSSSGGLNIEVAAGSGYVVSSTTPSDPLLFLEWSSALAATMPANSDRFVSIVAGPPVAIQLTASEPDVYNTILVGRMKSDGTDIIYQQNISRDGLHTVTLLDNTLRTALGALIVSGVIGQAGTGTFQLSVSSGRYFYSTHEYLPTGGTDVTFTEYFNSGGSITQSAPTNQLTAVNARRYDDGTNLVALAVGEWVKHVLYIVNDGSDEYFAFVYGQEAFASQNAAENGDLPLPPSFFGQNFVTVSGLVLGDSSTDWVTVQDVRPTLQFTASGVTATTNHGSLTGLLVDDHPQYLLVNGTRSMSGALNMGTQNITNAGTINGVDITNLSGNLQPGGSDALPTAAPVTIATSNNEGGSTSFARSDHIHAHGAQTDATLHAVASAGSNGFMSSSDKSKLDASTALPVPSTLMERDSSGEIALSGLTIESGGALVLNNSSNTFSTSLESNLLLGADYTLSLPPNTGSNGQVLTTDGLGGLSWTNSSGTANQMAVFNGVLENWGNGTRFVAWGFEVTSSSGIGFLHIPYSSTLRAYSVMYASGSAAGIGAGESVVVTLGTLATGLAPLAANYAPLAGTTITFDQTDNSTYPRKALTGLSTVLSAGTALTCRSVETGTVAPANAELIVTVWLDGSFT